MTDYENENEEMMARAEEVIRKAQERYPLSVTVREPLSEDDLTLIRQYCRVNCPSAYMNGEASYVIRYDGDRELTGPFGDSRFGG